MGGTGTAKAHPAPARSSRCPASKSDRERKRIFAYHLLVPFSSGMLYLPSHYSRELLQYCIHRFGERSWWGVLLVPSAYVRMPPDLVPTPGCHFAGGCLEIGLVGFVHLCNKLEIVPSGFAGHICLSQRGTAVNVWWQTKARVHAHSPEIAPGPAIMVMGKEYFGSHMGSCSNSVLTFRM